MTAGPEEPTGKWVPPASVGATSPPPLPGPTYQQPKKTSGFAVASLVLGIIGLPLICPLLIPSALAVVFGFIARRDVRDKGQGGQGMATAGLIMGFIGVVASLIVITVGIIYLANADWKDSDHDGTPNFIDSYPHDPKMQLIRPIAAVATCAIRSAFA